MELLKFNDAPKSARRGKNPAGFIGAGIMVAVMGLSSTLAGTITIGTGSVEFGQGIVTASACDGSITLTPTSKFQNVSGVGDTFVVSSITLSKIAVWSAANTVGACAGQVLEIRAFDSGFTPLKWKSDTATAQAIVIKIPATEPGSGWDDDAAYGAVNIYQVDGSGVIQSSVQATATLDAVGSTAAIASDNAGLSLALGGLSLSGSVTRFTVESRAPRSGE